MHSKARYLVNCRVAKFCKKYELPEASIFNLTIPIKEIILKKAFLYYLKMKFVNKFTKCTFRCSN